MKHLAITVMLFVPAVAVAAPSRLPSSSELLNKTLAQARREGLPAAALENKIKEGRAKGVPPARIAQVVTRFLGHMRTARTWLARPTQVKGKPRKVSPRLLVTVAEARLAGVKRAPLEALLAGKKIPSGAPRRVDTLVDLALRGYQGKGRVALLRGIRARQLPGLGQAADRLRRTTGLSRDRVILRLTQQNRISSRPHRVDTRRSSGAGKITPRRFQGRGSPPPPPPPARFR